MASVKRVAFVDESQNFDFEKNGKSSSPRKEKWSWLCMAESDESDVESIENEDVNSSGKDAVEKSSFEGESAESASFESASAWSSLSFASVDEDYETHSLNRIAVRQFR